MEKIRITGRDWDMSDWPPGELTVESFVMPLEGCGSNDDPAAVADAYGRELRIVGVRRAGDRAGLVAGTEVPGRLRTFEITREPRYEGYDSLHGSKRDAPDEFLVVVDGQRIGGTYWCSCNPAASAGWGWDDGGLPGESRGPRGLSCGHATREAAEQAQVREYATDPDRYDRLFAMDRAEREAAAARQQAGREAEIERREAGRRRARLGDDEPGPAVWVLPAYHAPYADMGEVRAVSAWFEANGLECVSGVHPVRVEQRAGRRAAVFEKPVRVCNGRGTQATETHVVIITTDPPPVTAPGRPGLHPLFAEHRPSRFPLIGFGQSGACGKCTRDAGAVTPDMMVRWPWTAEKAIADVPAAAGGCR